MASVRLVQEVFQKVPSVVYVLTNPAMPGICKIGKTRQEDVGTRLSQLYTTGVPVPFSLEYACQVDDCDAVEVALHTAFGPSRVNPKREFFRIEPEQAIAILKLLNAAIDATAEASSEPTGIDEQSLQAAKTLRSRRPNLNFEEMGIPTGATLMCLAARHKSETPCNRTGLIALGGQVAMRAWGCETKPSPRGIPCPAAC